MGENERPVSLAPRMLRTEKQFWFVFTYPLFGGGSQSTVGLAPALQGETGGQNYYEASQLFLLFITWNQVGTEVS